MTKLSIALTLLSLGAVLSGCASSSGSVTDKVLKDFGIRERSADEATAADNAMAQLDAIGQSELKRLNQRTREGEIKFEEAGELRGKYYKEKKVYERYYALDAQPTGRTRTRDKGFIGRIEYTYRIYQSARKNSRAEAAALKTEIPRNERGTETYTYRFNFNGTWNGQPGEPVAGR